LDLHRLFVLHFEEVIELLVQLVLQLFVEVYPLRAQQIVPLPGFHLSHNSCRCLFLVVRLHSENRLEGRSKLRIGLSGGECLLPYLDGLEHAQISHLGQHVDSVYLTGHFLLVGLDASHEVVGRRGQLCDQIINLLLKFLEEGLADLVFILIHEQSRVNVLDVSAHLVLVFEFEALDVVGDLALRMHNSEVFLLYKVELQKSIFAEISVEAAHHVLVLELNIWGVVVYDGKQRQFSRKQSNDVVVCRWVYARNFPLEAVLAKNHHLVLENVTIVLLQQFFIGKIDAKLLEGILSKVLETEDVEQVDRPESLRTWRV
jgi:hypothetical protein